jgi:CRISPR/Cas system-associated endoribonuclease Cas2
MPNFKGRLSEEEVEKIKGFIQNMADEAKKSIKK